MKTIVLSLSLSLLSISGCVSTAGPFVTDVRPGPRGTLVVERCKVQYQSSFGGSVSKTECATSSIVVEGPAAAPRAAR